MAGGSDARRGTLVERAVHHLDLCRFLLDDEFEELLAFATRLDEDVSLTARMESGALVTTAASDRLPYRNEVRVAGSAGRLRLLPDQATGLWLDLEPRNRPHGAQTARVGRWAAYLRRRVGARRSGGAYLGSFSAEWRALAQAVRDGTPAEPGLLSGRRLLETVLAAAASASTGTVVRRADAPRSMTPPA